MAGYKIFFKKSVEKDLKSAPARDLEKIFERISMLAENPRPPGCEQLTGRERYRIRQGAYRILYTIQDHKLTVWIIKIAHRKDAYR